MVFDELDRTEQRSKTLSVPRIAPRTGVGWTLHSCAQQEVHPGPNPPHPGMELLAARDVVR